MQARLLDVDTALLSPHTVVRRFREGDGEALYNQVQDNYNRLYDDFPSLIQAISSKEEGEFFVRRRLADWQLQQGYCFGIWHSKETQLIGMLYFTNIDWAVPKARVCFFIDRNHSEQGLMTESMLAGLDFVFRQLEIEKLELRTSMENVAAQRLARKCDFRREGDLRGDFRRPSGEIIDRMQFGLTRAEYLGI
ncbi:MAG: GNAT family N-acetyltransferase [Bacteroidetes bacterium]|jgi:RimJ/RimL family protein N-acetyltransferase|nr:GNAT family N-acetyltransferase [Bacteroidota bacterium]